MLTLDWFGYNDAKSAPENGSKRSGEVMSPLTAAQAEFAKGSWDTAIPLYKSYLRTAPADYQAWNQLAAAYYHSGQVKYALTTLQRIQRNSPDRSFNYFYQGMCIAVLGSDKDAIQYWEYAAYWPDEFGARATFELGTTFYKSGDEAQAKRWLTTYAQKFPRGPDISAAKDLLKSLEEGKKIDPVKGFDRPDPELTIFKYHPWSLFKTPHFWQVQVGVKNSESSGYQPTETGAIEARTESDSSVVVNASIGVGPIRQKNSTSFAGYTYRQNWFTDIYIVRSWIGNGLSLESFPIRGDMLERTHEFFGDVRRQFSDNLFAGAYARLQFSRVGSSFFPSPDDNSLKIVTPEKDTQLLIPWLGWTWSQTQRSMFSLYLRKEIHNQSSEHSNKTYDLTGSTGTPAISLGVSHAIDFPAKKVETTFDLFQYEFIFNDYWLDYSRTGAIAAVDYAIYKGLGANILVGIYQDKYKIPQIKTGSCGARPSESNGKDRVTCARADSGKMIQGGVYYNKTQNLRFEFSYLMVENGSSQKVYSESSTRWVGSVIWAFPGTKRVSRMTGRFADAAFTKDTDQ